MTFSLFDLAFVGSLTGAPTLDPDAAAYIAAVEAADTQALEPAVRAAINDFVVGCKADGIWAAIKASCILAGARTLTGALVPLVGAAPTNFNFVSGDYNRKTGLVGNGSTKYLDSNRNNNADPQDSKHLATYYTVRSSAGNPYIATSSANGGSLIRSQLLGTGVGADGADNAVTILNSAVSSLSVANGVLPSSKNLYAISRSNSSGYILRTNQSSISITSPSVSPLSENILLYRRGTENNYGNARLAFYSIGESLDLALLDARVTALIYAFDAAI
jgi:hypothetical protein